MKTSKLNSPQNSENIQKIQNIFLSMAGLFLIFLSGCTKEPLVIPGSKQTVNNELREAAILPRSFDMIKINHDANLSFTPDYSVTVNSNGLVTYDGRARVGKKGIVQFNVSKEMLKKLDDIFAPPSIADIKTDAESRQGCPSIPEHPIITTTYSNGREPAKIWIDYNTGYPQDVVARRKKVEELLDIAKLVKADILITVEAVEAEL